MSRYRHDALRVPDEAHRVATVDADGVLLNADGDPLNLDGANLEDDSVTRAACAFPAPILLQPNNSSGTASVNLSTANYDSGTLVVVEPTASAATHNVAITADGSFVDVAGVAVQQCVLNAAGSFAVFLIAANVTCLMAYKGADLTT